MADSLVASTQGVGQECILFATTPPPLTQVSIPSHYYNTLSQFHTGSVNVAESTSDHEDKEDLLGFPRHNLDSDNYYADARFNISICFDCFRSFFGT